MKTFLTIAAFLIIAQSSLHAQQVLGGDITWECVNSGPDNGKYVFTLTLFNQCSAGPLPTSNQTIIAHGANINTISLSYQSEIDISPSCYNPGLEISCDSASPKSVSKVTFQSQPIALSGVIPSNGWVFTWTGCCRPSTNNLVGNSGYTLRSIMYPHNGLNTSSCYDNSPQFLGDPIPIICSEYPSYLNHKVFDPDMDDLNHEFSVCFDSSSSWPANMVSWNPGYSTQSPFPGTFHDSQNIPASILDYNGEISFETVTNEGYHSYSTNIKSYRNGALIAEVSRDFTVLIDTCPQLPPPISTNNTPPAFTLRKAPNDPGSLPYPAIDTVTVGDSVTLYVTSTDVQFLPGFSPQTNYLTPLSSQFGTRFEDTLSGCLNAPCAILDHNNFYDSTNNRWQGPFGIATALRWQTDTIHGSLNGKVYNFHLPIYDDWCPHPGISDLTYTVVVLNPADTINTGLNHQFLDKQVTIFPNPAEDVVTLNINSLKNEIVQIDLFDISGNQLNHVSYASSSGKLQKKLNVQHLHSGIYLIRVTSKDFIVTKKFIKR